MNCLNFSVRLDSVTMMLIGMLLVSTLSFFTFISGPKGRKRTRRRNSLLESPRKVSSYRVPLSFSVRVMPDGCGQKKTSRLKDDARLITWQKKQEAKRYSWLVLFSKIKLALLLCLWIHKNVRTSLEITWTHTWIPRDQTHVSMYWPMAHILRARCPVLLTFKTSTHSLKMVTPGLQGRAHTHTNELQLCSIPAVADKLGGHPGCTHTQTLISGLPGILAQKQASR